jgi:hypothetical protein
MVEPAVAVDGIGAVVDPVVAVAVVYQVRLVPVAVNAVAVAF